MRVCGVCVRERDNDHDDNDDDTRHEKIHLEHLLPHLQCSPASISQVPSPNLLNSGMIISCQGLPLLWLCCQVRDESLSVPSEVGKWDFWLFHRLTVLTTNKQYHHLRHRPTHMHVYNCTITWYTSISFPKLAREHLQTPAKTCKQYIPNMASSSETPVSPIATRTPDLTFTIPAINAQPVELDSTPTSPDKARRLAAAASGQVDASPSSVVDREVLLSF